jgi:hypothetical protein
VKRWIKAFIDACGESGKALPPLVNIRKACGCRCSFLDLLRPNHQTQLIINLPNASIQYT